LLKVPAPVAQRYQQDPGLLFDKAAFLRTVSKCIFSGINAHIPIAVGGPKFHYRRYSNI